MNNIKYLDSIMNAIADNWIDHKMNRKETLDYWGNDVVGNEHEWEKEVKKILEHQPNNELFNEFVRNKTKYWNDTFSYFCKIAEKVEKDGYCASKGDMENE